MGNSMRSSKGRCLIGVRHGRPSIGFDFRIVVLSLDEYSQYLHSDELFCMIDPHTILIARSAGISSRVSEESTSVQSTLSSNARIPFLIEICFLQWRDLRGLASAPSCIRYFNPL